jgi:hypothetical protein
MLTTRPTIEDAQNYQIAIWTLNIILSRKMDNGKNRKSVDQFHAVNALSTLAQVMLIQMSHSTEINYISIDFQEALGLVASLHSDLLPDVTQALLEMGSVALEHEHYLFAVATMERILNLIEGNLPVTPKAQAEMLGLVAHFWASGGSSKEFITNRLGRVKACINESLSIALEKAKLHSQMTMRFDTADRLAQLATDLGSSRRSHQKK